MVVLKTREKRKVLIDDFKKRIISGQLKQGERLPTYEQLENQYDASRATLQYVIEQLRLDGYVNSVERQGLYVTDHSPMLNRYGILIQTHERENLFWHKLIQVANEISQEDSKNIEIYRYLADPELGKENWNNLREDLERKRLGGLIFTFFPKGDDQLGLIKHYDIPAFMFSPIEHDTVIPVNLDAEALVRRSIDYLQDQGRKRVSLITMGKQPQARYFVSNVEERGMETKEAWIQCVDRANIASASNIVQLLMALPSNSRPNGLVISDDNLIAPVTAGLIASGIKVPHDLEAVVHGNFPANESNVLNFKIVGYDCGEIIRQALESFKRYHTEKTIIPLTFEPKFSEEL